MKSKNIFSSPVIIALLHVLAWSFYFLFPKFIFPDSPPGGPPGGNPIPGTARVITWLLLVAFFYFNAYFLFPRIYYRNGGWRYAGSLLLCFIAMTGINVVIINGFYNWGVGYRIHLFANFFPMVSFAALSISFRLIRDKLRDDRLQKEKESEQLKTELSFLRSQVSPHFIFNVLNSLVSLARKKSDAMEPALIHLSGLLRYMLYDSDEKKVTLEHEAEYLRNYVELQQLRFGGNVNVITDINIPHPESGRMIEPMLLIPFVENAFKHGMGMIHNPEIRIAIKTNGKHIIFSVHNRYNPADNGGKDGSSGIGLANVRRRLELLYGKKHSLEISAQNDLFRAELNLSLL